MTDRELMQQALEALEEPKEHFAKHRRLEAITALRERLAQPVQDYLAGAPPLFPQMRDGETIVVAQPEQEPVIDHSCKDAYELIMKWADIYAAQTGCIYSEAAQDPSKVARMADERTMLACVVAQALSQQAQPEQEPVAWRSEEMYSPDVGSWFEYYDEFRQCSYRNDLTPLYTTPPQRTWQQEPVAAQEPRGLIDIGRIFRGEDK